MQKAKLKIKNEKFPAVRDPAKHNNKIIRKREKINVFFIGILGFVFLLLGSVAEAQSFTATGNPGDTAAGVVITAEASDQTLNYTDINGNPKPEVTPASDIEITVLPVYGFSTADLPDMSLFVEEVVTNEGYVTNEGNVSDTYTIYYSCNFDNDGAGTWTVNIRKVSDDSLIGTLTSGSPSTNESVPVAEDSHYGYYHEVTGPSSALGAPGDYIVVTTSRETTSTPTGEYTGANGLTYAGLGYQSDDTTYSIDKPLLVITRTSTVDAPVAGGAYSGGDHDKVPGSVITYTLTYSNEGNVAANNVILIDKIPANTNLAHFNQDGGTYVVITAAEGTGTWEASYSTVGSPNTDYGNTGDWTFVGTVEPGTSFPAGDLYEYTDGAVFTATWVKWEKSSIPTDEDNKTLTWGVTIR
jgi:uncharacterized repeat protein (TIGR01451 family)